MIDLSIIIVSYNTLEMTKACLRSVLDNKGSLIVEIIVIDNASIDGSVEMLKEEFADLFLVFNDDNRGFAAANNQGFLMANGKYILLLNSDTLVLGDVLGASLNYLEKNSEVGGMGCQVLNTNGSTQMTCSGYPTLARLAAMTFGLDRLASYFDHYQLRSWARNSEREVEVISGCYLLIRKSILDSIGGLDERFFFFGEETDWCLRMRLAGWSLRFAPVGQIIHHGGGSVKKLNHRRDLMLTEATIRLHKNNNGYLSAAIAYVLLAVFNFSRAILWNFLAIFSMKSRERAKHFRGVAGGTFSTWPKDR